MLSFFLFPSNYHIHPPKSYYSLLSCWTVTHNSLIQINAASIIEKREAGYFFAFLNFFFGMPGNFPTANYPWNCWIEGFMLRLWGPPNTRCPISIHLLDPRIELTTKALRHLPIQPKQQRQESAVASLQEKALTDRYKSVLLIAVICLAWTPPITVTTTDT